MENIFNGYVMCYRKFCWHQTSNYSDMTRAELHHFSELGQMLGFRTKFEDNWDFPRDLVWIDENSKTPFLYMERENKDDRCKLTIEKLLNPENSRGIKNLIAAFGWLKPDTFKMAEEKILELKREEQDFLLFAWVGEKQDEGNFVVSASLFANGKKASRTAIPSIDSGGFWQINFPDGSAWG